MAVSREVRVTGDGPYMTAHEIMMACSEVPYDLVPTIDMSLGGKVKALKFKVDFMPGGPAGPGTVPDDTLSL